MTPRHDPVPPVPLAPDAEFHRRRRQRAMITGVLLGAMVVLFYLIAIAKMS